MAAIALMLWGGAMKGKVNSKGPNPLVNRPRVILLLTEKGWSAQFENSRAEMSLGFPRGAPLYEVVEGLRDRWPNCRIAFDEVVLEDPG